MFKHSLQKVWILFILVGGMVSCSVFPPTPDNLIKISLSTLLITSQDLPPGLSQYGSPGPSSDDRTTDSMAVAFLIADSPSQNYGISQTIFRFKSADEAKANYNDLAPVYFGDVPPDWNFKSQYSDSSYISCYTYSNDPYPSCVWTGRYHTIVIKVAANLYPGHLTLSDLENIIGKIDAKAGKVILGK